MKKILLVVTTLTFAFVSFGQSDKKTTKDLLSRAGDHIMLQLSTDHWAGAPDSIKNRMKSLSRSGNIYVMMNKPFKSNPSLSLAFGIGIGTGNIYFTNTSVNITSSSAKLPFVNLDTLNRFKKYKLSTAYLEIPVEFRYTANPENDRKSIKAAIGFKVGTLLKAQTKGKNLENKNGGAISSATVKESSKNFFNTTRFAATARIGYGNFSLFGSYQINNLFKDGVAPEIKPFQIGLTLSGL